MMFLTKEMIQYLKTLSYGNFYLTGLCATNPLETSLTVVQFGICRRQSISSFIGPANTYTQIYGCKWN